MTRIYWVLDWGPLYGRYPLLGIGNLRVLLSAASMWQGSGGRKIRLPKRPIPRQEMILDSGAFSLLTIYPDYPFSFETYLETARTLAVDWVAARDVPCEPWGKIDLTVSERIRKTVDAASDLLAEIPSKGESNDLGNVTRPLPVIQGWTPADYVACIDGLRSAGAITDFMAVGSCCKRSSIAEVFRIAEAIRAELPSRTKLHFFGLKTSALADPRFREIAFSVDTGAWTFAANPRPEGFDGDFRLAISPQDRSAALYTYRHRLFERIRDSERASVPSMEKEW